MTVETTDRNLLFALVALQMDFLTRDTMVEAMQAWMLDKSRPISEILLSRGSLSGSQRQLLDALVAEHVRVHAGDARQSLASLSSVAESVREQLGSLGDEQLEESLTTLPQHDDKTPPLPEVATGGAAGSGTAPRGRFRILRPHAKGGLGEVSVALDEELNREVALKEIQARYAGNLEAQARFVQEAEITGGLEHPGIVPVYGLGHQRDGRPFYAMQFVRGDSLKDAIDRFHQGERGQRRAAEVRLELRQLLGRFIDVCEAVAYAHSRGVLHRDLKPANIMLGKYGETLVVDWGLAKSVGRGENPSSDEPTLRPSSQSGSTPTLAGSAMGTPAFMSPEQAAGQIDQIGPLSDVYSLGATLYMLLTGRPPFSSHSRDVLKQVQQGSFPRPRQVRGDVPRPLEAICLKAMATRPEDRYATPRQLAEDVEHWMADESVSAYRDGTLERLARLARRHRAWAMSAAATLALVTLVSTVAASIIYGKNDQLAQLAKSESQARLDAERKTAELGTAYGKMAEMHAELGPTSQALDNAGKSVEILKQLVQQDPDEVAHRDNLARTYFSQAQFFQRVGRLQESENLLRRAIELREDILAAHPDDPEYRRLLSNCLNGLASTLYSAGRFDEAEGYYRTMLEMSEQLIREFPNNASYQADVASGHHNLGLIHEANNRIEDAMESLQEGARLRESLVAEQPDMLRYRRDLVHSLNELGRLQQQLGDLEATEASFTRAMEFARQLAIRPAVISDRRAFAALSDNLANIHGEKRDFEKALELGRKGLQWWRRLAIDEPGVAEFQANLAMAHVRVANFLAQTGQLSEALESLGEAEAIYQRGELADSQDLGVQMRFASVAAQIGNYLALLGQQRKALEKFDEALELLEPVIAAAPEHPVATYTLANALSGKADTQSRLGEHAAALEAWDQALAVASPQMQTFVRLGRALARARGGDHEAALAEANQIEPFAEPPGGHAHMLGSLYSLAAAATHAEAASPDVPDKEALMDRANELARRAVELLGEARAAGLYRHQAKELLNENPDLEFLRKRGALEKLLPAATDPGSPDSGASTADPNSNGQ